MFTFQHTKHLLMLILPKWHLMLLVIVWCCYRNAHYDMNICFISMDFNGHNWNWTFYVWICMVDFCSNVTQWSSGFDPEFPCFIHKYLKFRILDWNGWNTNKSSSGKATCYFFFNISVSVFHSLSGCLSVSFSHSLTHSLSLSRCLSNDTKIRNTVLRK